MIRILFVIMLAVAGCKPKDGALGPVGPQGPSGDAVPGHQAVFRSGVSPDVAYAVTLDNVDRANPDTAYLDNGTVRIANASGDHPRRLLVRFPVAGYIPSNATVMSAVLQMATVSSTSIDGAVTVGVYDMGQTVMTDGATPCIWTVGATWNRFDGTWGWGTCGGGASLTKGDHYPVSPMDSVVIPAASSGTDTLWAWNLDTATVQKWLATPAKNNGLVVTSVAEWSDTASGSLVFAHNAHASERFRPTLIVNYYIP